MVRTEQPSAVADGRSRLMVFRHEPSDGLQAGAVCMPGSSDITLGGRVAGYIAHNHNCVVCVCTKGGSDRALRISRHKSRSETPDRDI